MSTKKKIKKILIPNRGEIAIRIQRTCRELNIATAAVFSEPDRHAQHVRYADEAYLLPGSAAKDTYLNQDLIFKIAEQCGADAIHPGYGFLSENAEFSRRCKEHGIRFIGPPAEAIELMGLKTEARRVMQEAGVPVVPGTEPLATAEIAAAKAEEIGYPVLIKATAGGGGKGMRRVEKPGELKPAFEACRREARGAFGDPRVYIEKYLTKPRHVEFQVLADLHGNTIHLYERECSIQRRHQKIIEETPSPVVDEDMRLRMGKVAVEAARACGYANAGTVEFMVDADKNFYFLEMNTRLQVEHPITEMITGIDLVERQVRIAEGESLTFDSIPRHGAAIECRIYAEDPSNNFLPSPGLIKGLTDPGGPGIRNDSGVYAGFTIPMEYDPLISKLVVWGENRSQALARMLRALEEYHLLGIRTNIPYLRKIIMHPEFISGDYDTHFIDRHQESLLEAEPEEVKIESIALAAAAILRLMGSGEQARQSQTEAAAPGTGQPRVSNWKLSGRIHSMQNNGSMGV
ncbi:MAG: acetyl-CoA carboxylase biotin carboxylase subunit [Candidatus Aminicenantes bacterium]|nr:acetyl-CoA carboxylase biotin carboxylase subunit [Candidatus Aminicenantes bacterium]NIM82023.1 acetyl-CoA carboxylase biotin carboxylase subunit [Candidatus Aminicenantes bacterium]NIN21407.1 acetyl-CoA carboxylase biotin carboxylase subunit [Candidatus Aminicenantes bacterium]NIN45234.1 acetyl-CoA carboxylase biotin carboxylase subunit [Candidatus Aminicenantes bacterium]NIN88054.1 acetyl-CoA carboxylase biotin carboxylase subunit [Candidatus Aminicenantes bacterium]